MEIVGPSALEMTMNGSGHVALDDQREALDRLNGLLDEGSRHGCCQLLLSGATGSAALRRFRW